MILHVAGLEGLADLELERRNRDPALRGGSFGSFMTSVAHLHSFKCWVNITSAADIKLGTTHRTRGHKSRNPPKTLCVLFERVGAVAR